MSKLRGLAGTLMLLLVAAPSQNVRSQSEKLARYMSIEAYEVRPGILMIPRYSDDGQVCEIGLEMLHYTPEKIILNPTLSREVVTQIVDELVPASERGPKTKIVGERDMIDIQGMGMTTSSEYENVSIDIHSYVLPGSKPRKIVAEDVTATVRWKNRKCQ